MNKNDKCSACKLPHADRPPGKSPRTPAEDKAGKTDPRATCECDAIMRRVYISMRKDGDL